MDNKSNYKYLLSDLSILNGVGNKTTNLLKKKKINNIFDLLWKLPKSYTDRSLSSKIKDLKLGEIQTITIVPKSDGASHQTQIVLVCIYEYVLYTIHDYTSLSQKFCQRLARTLS